MYKHVVNPHALRLSDRPNDRGSFSSLVQLAQGHPHQAGRIVITVQNLHYQRLTAMKDGNDRRLSVT